MDNIKFQIKQRSIPEPRFSYNGRYIPNRKQWREYNSTPRIYVSIENENIWENLVNRRSRPSNFYKKNYFEALTKFLIETTGITSNPKIKASWSQKAGCSCGCSPGFVFTNAYEFGLSNKDVWITVPKTTENQTIQLDLFETK